LNNIARRLSLPLLLAVLTLAALGGVVGNGFIELDDGEYITRNDMVRGGLSARGVVDAFTTTRHGFIWHPVTWVSHMIDVELFGLRPGPHHAVSLALHTASVLLLFFLLRSLTGAPGKSALVAALFAVHPLHVESVAWAAERKDVLSTFFALCTALAYQRAARRNAVVRSVAIPLLFALALLSKAMVVTLPFLFLLLDCWPLGRWTPAARRRADGLGGIVGLLPPIRLWVEKVPLFLLCAVSAAATYVAQDTGGTVSSKIPAVLRLSNACVAYVRYLGKTIWPQGLSPFYPYPFEGLPPATVAGAVALLLVISAVAWRLASRRPYLALGWLWFLGTLVPVIGLVQTGGQAMADRYTYFPLTGIFVAVTWGVADILARRRFPALTAGALSVVLLVALAAVSRAQAALWRDTRTLFTHAVALDSRNWVALTAFGSTLADEGRWEEAAEYYRRSLAISDDYFDSNHQLGVTLAALERPREALPYLQRAALIRGDDPINTHMLGRTFLKLGRPEEALGYLRAAAALAPGNAFPRADFGAALGVLGKPAEAREQFEEALRLDPSHPIVHYNLGMFLLSQGQPAEAVAHFRKSLESNPGNPDTCLRLGETLFEIGKPEEAIVHLKRAVELKPADAVALTNLGVALAATGRLEAAETAFRRALALDGGSVDTRLNLGVALMDRGRLAEAADELVAAAALDPGNPGLSPALERLLGKPSGKEAYNGALRRK
jgi:Flp pilus assembly protein TadD